MKILDTFWHLNPKKLTRSYNFKSYLDKVSIYAVSNLDDEGHIKLLYIDLKDPTQAFRTTNKPIKPDTSDEEVDEVDMEIYCKEVKQFVRRKGTLRQNLEKSYGLVWGQCLAGLQTYI